MSASSPFEGWSAPDPSRPEPGLGPVPNPNLTGVATASVFGPDECARIVGSCDEAAWEPGTVVTRQNPSDAAVDGRPSRVDSQVRRAELQPVAGTADVWPLRTITEALRQTNDRFFRFDLWGFGPGDHPNVVRYHGADHGWYAGHLDLTATTSLRKLSFTLQLSDPQSYDGGDVRFWHRPEQPASREMGSLTVFPAYLGHSVSAVTRGVRYCIVGWISGPPFR